MHAQLSDNFRKQADFVGHKVMQRLIGLYEFQGEFQGEFQAWYAWRELITEIESAAEY